jgi:cytochrome b-561
MNSYVQLFTCISYFNEQKTKGRFTSNCPPPLVLFFEYLQWATGFWTFWYPGGSRSGRASPLPWHVFFGIFIYVLAIVTSVSGLLEKSIFMQSAKMIGRFSTEAMFMNSLGMLLLILGTLVILAIVSPGPGKIDTYRGSSE